MSYDSQRSVTVAVCVSDRWQVTGDAWLWTPDTWHMTHDTWHMTHDTWHLPGDTWHMIFEYFFLFLVLLLARVERFSVFRMRFFHHQLMCFCHFTIQSHKCAHVSLMTIYIKLCLQEVLYHPVSVSVFRVKNATKYSETCANIWLKYKWSFTS